MKKNRKFKSWAKQHKVQKKFQEKIVTFKNIYKIYFKHFLIWLTVFLFTIEN